MSCDQQPNPAGAFAAYIHDLKRADTPSDYWILSSRSGLEKLGHFNTYAEAEAHAESQYGEDWQWVFDQTAMLALLSDIQQQLPQQTHYAVTGCIPFDDDDTTYLYVGLSREEAIQAFTDDIYTESGRTDQERVENEHGTPVFITCILKSTAPIERE